MRTYVSQMLCLPCCKHAEQECLDTHLLSSFAIYPNSVQTFAKQLGGAHLILHCADVGGQSRVRMDQIPFSIVNECWVV